MSVINQFEVLSFRYGVDPKVVYMIDINKNKTTFSYHIRCRVNTVSFFFNMKSQKLLISVNYMGSHVVCGLMSFWFNGDYPVPSVVWLQGQEKIMDQIHEDFKQQHAAYLVDNIINDE